MLRSDLLILIVTTLSGQMAFGQDVLPEPSSCVQINQCSSFPDCSFFQNTCGAKVLVLLMNRTSGKYTNTVILDPYEGRESVISKYISRYCVQYGREPERSAYGVCN